jgi:hypothetical protein
MSTIVNLPISQESFQVVRSTVQFSATSGLLNVALPLSAMAGNRAAATYCPKDVTRLNEHQPL